MASHKRWPNLANPGVVPGDLTWLDWLTCFSGWKSWAPGLVVQAVLALSIVAAVGLAHGSIGFRGIRLGAAGVLFAGIFFGQLGMHLDERILEFVRDFGLILFVYTIGLQVGPSFFPSLRRQGLELNVLAAVIVLLGGLIAACLRSALYSGGCRDFLRRHYQYTELGCRSGSASGF